MKKLNLIFIGTCVLGGIIFSGCLKQDDPVVPKATTKPSDQAASSEVDGALNDVNDVINNKVGSGSSHRVAAYNLPCGVVSIDSTNTIPKTYTLNYGVKTPCGYKYKSGTISFALQNGTAFNQVGAVFLTTFNSYTVEVQATGSIVTLNGTIRTTNVNGGYIWEAVTSSATITHKIRGAINITYSDNTIRPRSYFQQRVWSSSTGWAGLNLTISGDTIINSVTGISETGKTYDGNYDYQTQISTPFQWSNCGTTWAGPYVLKTAHARMNVTIPAITPAYFDVEGGYYWNIGSSSTPTLSNGCNANAYKIILMVGTTTETSYQLY
jgi:hypothetical protein